MRIVGIDPGLQCTGWGVIGREGQNFSYIASGTIITKRAQSLDGRLYALHEGLLAAINEYQPDAAAIEETFVNSNAKSSLLLGHVRGALILTCMISGVKSFEQYSANHIKKTITGYGHADKGQMMRMLPYIINGIEMNDMTHDMVDALAIAICHAYYINK